jgi:dTMP kinase
LGLDRARSRNSGSRELQSESRLEGEDLVFHRRVREGYLTLALAEPHRFEVIDARGTVDEVAQRVSETLLRRAPQLLRADG